MPEVIIRKNAESGPEKMSDLRRESMRSYFATLQRPKRGGVGKWRVPEGGFPEGLASPALVYTYSQNFDSAAAPDGAPPRRFRSLNTGSWFGT